MYNPHSILWIHHFHHNSNGFWGWEGWTAISAVVMAATLIAICLQINESRKLTKFTVMPTAYFVLRSARTLHNLQIQRDKDLKNIPDKDIPKEWEISEKLRTLFVVKNNSKFQINFYLKISFKLGDKELDSMDRDWKNPMRLYPGESSYPQVFELKNYIKEDDLKNNENKIAACFHYKYSPIFAKDQESEIMTDIWYFDLQKFEWIGANGVRDIGLTKI